MTAPSAGPLIGRARDLEALRGLVAATGRGRGATVLVEGEAGIGKTRLLAWLAAAARAAGLGVLRGSAHALERTRPFGPLVEALGLRADASDPGRRAIGRLLAGGPERADAPAPRADPGFHVADEIVDLVEALSARRPMLLALDDIHWADSSTLAAVRAIARRVAAPLLLAATMRPSPRGAELAGLLDALLADGATRVRLAPLAGPEVDDLVRAELGRPPGQALAAMVRRAGGNPLWVVEILRSLQAEGALVLRGESVESVDASLLPAPLRELVLRRLAQLPGSTVRTLRAASVLGEAFPLADLAAFTGRSAVSLLDDLDEALNARILGEDAGALVFRHALVRDAVYHDIPEPARVALHREAGRALAAAGAPLTRVAGHAYLGALPGDERAVDTLRRAARDAAAPAPGVAVDLLRRAESLLPDGHPRRDAVLAELAAALLRAGRVAEAAALAEAALARPHDPAAGRALRLSLMEALSLQNRPADLIARARAALAATPPRAPADRALVLAQMSLAHTFSGDPRAAERAARDGLAQAEADGGAAMRAWCLAALSLAMRMQGRYAEALRHARAAESLAFRPPDRGARLRHPRFFLGLALCDADRLDEAAAAYRAAARECEELGSAWILPDTRLMAAELRFLTGEWDDAVPELESGMEAAAERGAMVLAVQSRGYLALIAAARGDRAAAQAALAPVALQDRGPPAYGTEVALRAAALLEEAAGRPAAALALLRRAWARDAEAGGRYHHRLLGPALARQALALGEPALARQVAAALDEGAALAPEVPTVRSAALRCRGLLGGDAEAALEAVELARRGGRVLDEAGAREDAADVLARLGRTADARGVLDEAVARYEALGATWLAARAGGTLRGLGGRRGSRGPRGRPAAGWDALTPSERAVAGLVAEGLTNRAIGRRLFISPHTVNSHLRRAFRKLAVANRAGLAAEVARRAPPAGGSGGEEDRAFG